MSDEILVSQAGLESMKAELEYLKKIKMPIIVKRIEEAIKLGDLSENAEYHEAKDDQGMTAAKIRELEAKIHRAQVVEKSSDGVIDIGSKIIVVDDEGNTKEYEIVDQTQADPASGKVSNESPLGSGFLGYKDGDVVDIELPAGIKTYTIKKVS